LFFLLVGACAHILASASAGIAEYFRRLLDPVVSQSSADIEIEGIGGRLVRDGHVVPATHISISTSSSRHSITLLWIAEWNRLSASHLGDEANACFDTGDIEMLSNLEIVALSAVIAICVAATWAARQQPSSTSLIFGAPSMVRSFPASAFGGARTFTCKEEESFDEMSLGPFS